MRTTRTFTWPSVGLLLLTGLVPGLTSCDEDEVATGAAVVAVGAAVAAHLDDDDDDHRRCYDYWDYGGRRHRECYRRRWRHEPARRYTPEQLARTPASQVITADELAESYLLSRSNAQTFLDAIEQSRQGEIDAILGLGFTRDDVDAMSRMYLRGISEASIDRMARHLDQRREMTKGMVARMINHARQLQREREANGPRDRF